MRSRDREIERSGDWISREGDLEASPPSLEAWRGWGRVGASGGADGGAGLRACVCCGAYLLGKGVWVVGVGEGEEKNYRGSGKLFSGGISSSGSPKK